MPVNRTQTEIGKNIDRTMRDIDRTTLQVGWFASAKYPKGQPVAMVAAAHEFGVPSQGLPPRPFMRPTLTQKRDRWMRWLAERGKVIMRGDDTVANVLNQLGLAVSGDIKAAISRVTMPPLKPATVKAKMRKRKTAKTPGNLTKPLVDTGLMIASVTHRVSQE